MKKITALQAYSLGWKFFKQNILQHIGVFLLVGIVLWIISMLLMPDMSSMWFKSLNMSPEDMVAMQKNMSPPFLAMLVLLIIEIFAYLFLYGYTLDIVRNQYKGLGEVFSKYVRGSIFLYVVIFVILFFLVAIAIVILVAGLTAIFQNESLLFFGMLISYLIILYFAMRLFFAFYFLLDGYDFVDAIRLSWQKTKPYIGEIFLFIIIPLIIFIVATIILILIMFKNPALFIIAYVIFSIASLIIIPYLMFAQSAFYSRAVSDETPQSGMPTSLEQ